jgi:malate synthase
MLAEGAAMTVNGLEIRGEVSPEFAQILTPDALSFVASLERRFDKRRRELLRLRDVRQVDINAGIMPDFLPETEHVRNSEWTVAPIPPDLEDRRVEITGPVERKMIINALNSGANVFMADFEDSHSPTWMATIEGQINLRDAVDGVITFTAPNGKFYQLKEEIATLMVRPRGWHLEEKHVLVDGHPISASLFDFGLFFFHNARNQIDSGTGPYFYLPKLESHLEARLWNDVFVMAQDELGIPQGTIRATVLIENILATFEADEILYELSDHSAGLNCGRWDYIFSAIRKFQRHPEFFLPDRAKVTMTTPMMRSYSLYVIKVCHQREIHAMGGMAAQIPIKRDPEANFMALEKVRADKVREAKDGHDGTWVAHPGLVLVAKEEFDRYMPTPNQIFRKLDDLNVNADELLAVPEGTITEEGLRLNVDVGIQYMASWLSGNGCVPIYNLMEDAATAEISRSQIWQWLHNPHTKLVDGRPITPDLFHEIIVDVLTDLKGEVGEEFFTTHNYELAAKLFEEISLQDEFADFLTITAYDYLD